MKVFWGCKPQGEATTPITFLYYRCIAFTDLCKLYNEKPSFDPLISFLRIKNENLGFHFKKFVFQI